MNDFWSRFSSRKWIAAVVGAIYSMVAFTGFDIPVDQGVWVDIILAFYIFVEGVKDIVVVIRR